MAAKGFWEEFNDTELGNLANMLLQIVPSFSFVERIFSQLFRKKAKNRNEMLPNHFSVTGFKEDIK